MALDKILKTEVGQITTYHRIQNIEFNYDTDSVKITLANYASEEYRNKEKEDIALINSKIDRYNFLLPKVKKMQEIIEKNSPLLERYYRIHNIINMNDGIFDENGIKHEIQILDSDREFYNKTNPEQLEKEIIDNSLSESELDEFRNLDIQELYAYKIEPKQLSSIIYTIQIDEDIRKHIYDNIVSKIVDFQDSVMI